MSGKAAFIGEQQAKLLAVPPPTLFMFTSIVCFTARLPAARDRDRR